MTYHTYPVDDVQEKLRVEKLEKRLAELEAFARFCCHAPDVETVRMKARQLKRGKEDDAKS